MRIFLYESEIVLRETLKEFLENSGHEILVAVSEKDLVRAVRDDHRPVDLIIAEKGNPRGSERSFLETLHEIIPETPFLLTTPTTNVYPPDFLVSRGVVACLRKPFSFLEMERTLDLVKSGKSTTGKCTIPVMYHREPRTA